MARKPKEIDFDAEERELLDSLRGMIGREVPLRSSYVRGVRPILVAIEQNQATLRFSNGAEMRHVPLRDLVDDSNYWRT